MIILIIIAVVLIIRILCTPQCVYKNVKDVTNLNGTNIKCTWNYLYLSEINNNNNNINNKNNNYREK